MKGVLLCVLCLIGAISGLAEEDLIETKVVSVNYLEEVTVKFPAQVIIKHGNKNEYYIKGDEASVKEVKVKAHGGEVVFEKKALQIGPTNIKNITIYITIKNLIRLNTEGAVSVDLKNITGDKLALNSKGKSNIRGDIAVKELNVNLEGHSTVNLKGRVQRQEVDAKGYITYDASSLASNEVEMNLEGNGQVTVKVSQKLSIAIAGSITVLYSGNPKNIKKNITGSGILRKI